ncbi:MAG: hypothetical protein IT581_02065 [Verrucomicrobiales bacterium]|nr:hypothetical protein [Verrucomicrobiales bacterium]
MLYWPFSMASRRCAAGWFFAALLTSANVASRGADEVRIQDALVGRDGRLQVRVASTTNQYFVLYRSGGMPANTRKAVAIQAGEDGMTTLSENLGAAGLGGFYQVMRHARSSPGDTDGDGKDDVTEMDNPVRLSPLNPAKEIAFRDGTASIPDRVTFKELSYQGDQVAIDTQLKGLEFVKFQIEKANTTNPELFFINTVTHRSHPEFMRAVGISAGGGGGRPSSGTMRGVMVFHPLLLAPNGEPGLYTIEFEPTDSFPFAQIQLAQELVAANASAVRNNLGYHPIGPAISRASQEKALYAASRIPVYLDADLLPKNIGYLPLHLGQAFGRLRLMEANEQPTARDIVIFRSLPNELSRVAGMITEVPQTPLSHVNLRAIQDDSPNAFITGASSNAAIAALIGKNVFFKVEADGYSVREATLEEVDNYFADLRPKESQVPARDLSVTKIRPLGSIAFQDSINVGVKVANLATLRTLGFPEGTIPDGFGIPFYFYDEFMKFNGFYEQATSMMADADFRASAEVQDEKLAAFRKRIKDAPMPDWMMAALDELHASFPEGSSIRCRSSTNNEDLPGFSGAGLYDSFTHHPEEGHLSKTIKQVYASLWNYRAFDEREFYRIDHLAAAMGVLVHLNFTDEQANGVAVTTDPIYQTQGNYYLNAQLGEDLVTNPEALSVPEEVLISATGTTATLMRPSNLIPDGERLLKTEHLNALRTYLGTIQRSFRTLYKVATGATFAMEIEYKVTKEGKVAIKQTRPWLN